MSTSNTGGQAFPQSWHDSYGTYWEHGMSLRDYFAAKALQGAVASPFRFTNDDGATSISTPDEYAALAYQFADAMLKAREA